MSLRLTLILAAAVLASLSPRAQAEEAPAPQQTLITNVNVFDGKNDALTQGQNVLVEGNLIKAIGPGVNAGDGAIVIDGGGRTLMPGLIDGHAHVMINAHFDTVEGNLDPYDLAYRSALVAKRFLLDGFTAVRDMGGPTFALRRNIDAGFVVGPRIYPSGGFISQTSGHGDFRDRADAGFSFQDAGDLSNFERMGIGNVADGVPEVLKATRLNLRNGATQIKIMGGGGGSSRFDPIDTTQYSEDEICAIVEAAADWGTYVAAHTFTDRAVNRLLDCGVKTFEHAFFISEDTMKRIAKKGGVRRSADVGHFAGPGAQPADASGEGPDGQGARRAVRRLRTQPARRTASRSCSLQTTSAFSRMRSEPAAMRSGGAPRPLAAISRCSSR